MLYLENYHQLYRTVTTIILVENLIIFTNSIKDFLRSGHTILILKTWFVLLASLEK